MGHRTFTLEALFDQTPQQTPTVVAESGTHVVVRLEAVRHVDFEALLLELDKHSLSSAVQEPGKKPAPSFPAALSVAFLQLHTA